jgi:hypothetical protein
MNLPLDKRPPKNACYRLGFGQGVRSCGLAAVSLLSEHQSAESQNAVPVCALRLKGIAVAEWRTEFIYMSDESKDVVGATFTM